MLQRRAGLQVIVTLPDPQDKLPPPMEKVYRKRGPKTQSGMEQMVGMKRPFYKAGPVMRLERIPADEFAAFLEARFAATGLKPEAGLGDAIVDLAGNLPYDVQRLAHETWDRATTLKRRTVGLEDLHRTLTRLLGE